MHALLQTFQNEKITKVNINITSLHEFEISRTLEQDQQPDITLSKKKKKTNIA